MGKRIINSIMISVSPMRFLSLKGGWIELILSKNRPNLEPPFTCYVYCTKNLRFTDIKEEYHLDMRAISGHVAGEFTCGRIKQFIPGVDFNYTTASLYMRTSGLMSANEIWNYSDQGKHSLYGFEVSDTKAYENDRLLELYDFTSNGKKIVLPPRSYIYVDSK